MRYCAKCFAFILENGQGHCPWCPLALKSDILDQLHDIFGNLKEKPKRKWEGEKVSSSPPNGRGR